jgi:hypothetical protein
MDISVASATATIMKDVYNGTDLHNGNSDVEPWEATRKSSHTERSTRHLSKKPRIDRVSLDQDEVPYSLRSLFQRSSVDERTEFISWLFEGALARCVSEPLSRGSLLPSSQAETKEKPPKSRQTKRRKSSQALNGIQASERHSRKGEPWSTEEEDLLIRLRKEQNLQ